MLNEEFIASLDYLISTCLWPSIVDARNQALYYHQRVAFYKHFDGREGRSNWRSELYQCLSDWQGQFPDVVRKRKSMIDDLRAQEPVSPGTGVRIPDGWI